MRVPLSWLAEHVDLGGVSAAVLADRLTFAGIEVERVDRVGEDIAGVFTARVLDVRAHPNADKLVLVTVEAGGEPCEVVCGAHNFAPGDVVPCAAPGAKLPGGLEIGRRQVRGTTSDGMLASARELDIFDDHSGILEDVQLAGGGEHAVRGGPAHLPAADLQPAGQLGARRGPGHDVAGGEVVGAAD